MFREIIYVIIYVIMCVISTVFKKWRENNFIIEILDLMLIKSNIWKLCGGGSALQQPTQEDNESTLIIAFHKGIWTRSSIVRDVKDRTLIRLLKYRDCSLSNLTWLNFFSFRPKCKLTVPMLLKTEVEVYLLAGVYRILITKFNIYWQTWGLIFGANGCYRNGRLVYFKHRLTFKNLESYI
jgi:hypothetical protein